jgi:hypothetical protein
MTIFFDEGHLLFSDSDFLKFQRFNARCRSAGGWIIGEAFDERFDTEVGGFSHVAQQWVNESGQLQGDWKRTGDGEIELVRCPSVIVDYANAGKRYTLDEAQALPELSGVLARLQEREAAYVAFLAKKEAEKARREKRGRLLKAELLRRRVRFLPSQVMRTIYAQAGV